MDLLRIDLAFQRRQQFNVQPAVGRQILIRLEPLQGAGRDRPLGLSRADDEGS